MINVVEALLELGRLVQAGRVGFSLLVMDENEDKTKALASANELVVKYTNKGPVIYIKQPDNMGGELVPITSIDQATLHKILNKLIIMGKDEPKREDMTDNTIWIRTMEDSDGSNKSTSKDVIRSFYEYIDKNKNTITPYIQKIYRNGTEVQVVPFVHEKQVYVRLKADGEIEDLYTVLRRILKNIDNNKQIFDTLKLNIDRDIAIIRDKIADWLDKIGEATLEVPKMKLSLEQSLKNVVDSLNIDDIIPFLEKKIRPYTFTVPGRNTETHLVKLKLKSDWDIGNISRRTIEDINKLSGYYDFFNSPLIVEHGGYNKNRKWLQNDFVTDPAGWAKTQIDTLMSEMLVIGSYGSNMPKQYYYNKKISPGTPATTSIHSGYGTNHRQTNFTFIKRGDRPQMIFDVRRFYAGEPAGSGTDAEFSYIVVLRGGEVYTLWSRYIENIEVIFDPDRQTPGGGEAPPLVQVSDYENGYVTLFTPIGRQAYLNKANFISFTEQLYVAKEIMLGNSYIISVEE